MEKESVVKVPQGYQKLSPVETPKKKKKIKLYWSLIFIAMLGLVYSIVTICHLKWEVELLQKKMSIMQVFVEKDIELFKNIENIISEMKIIMTRNIQNKLESNNSKEEEEEEEDAFSPENKKVSMKNADKYNYNYYYYYDDDENDDDDDDGDDDDEVEGLNTKSDEVDAFKHDDADDGDDEDDSEREKGKENVKRKREIRDYESSVERDVKSLVNETENKSLAREKSSSEKSSIEKSSAEFHSSLEKSSEWTSKEKFIPSTYRLSRKSHPHRKHRKSRIGSAEKFFTETHSTTSVPIQVRRSRTKATELHEANRKTWLQSQMLQQHTSPIRDTITKEEAILKGYRKHDDNARYELETSEERRGFDALSYQMIAIHFSADTSHYSRERDLHYFGNGRMQIKSEVYKDWKPAHWTQGVEMSKYFHLNQGRVTVTTTGIYLIYAQIQYSNVQEVNGFSVFRNKEVVVQCITTSIHPDKQEIKSNTCGISTTILLQSNDSVCIKDLHHGRYVVLTPEKSYFGLVLLSHFKN